MRTSLFLPVLLACVAGCSFEGTEAPPTPPTEPAVELERPSFDSRPACQAFVEHLNGLDCVPDSAHLRAELVCDDTLGNAACDATAYWACATAATTCEAGRLKRAVEACPDPCGALAESGTVEPG